MAKHSINVREAFWKKRLGRGFLQWEVTLLRALGPCSNWTQDSRCWSSVGFVATCCAYTMIQLSLHLVLNPHTRRIPVVKLLLFPSKLLFLLNSGYWSKGVLWQVATVCLVTGVASSDLKSHSHVLSLLVIPCYLQEVVKHEKDLLSECWLWDHKLPTGKDVFCVCLIGWYICVLQLQIGKGAWEGYWVWYRMQ